MRVLLLFGSGDAFCNITLLPTVLVSVIPFICGNILIHLITYIYVVICLKAVLYQKEHMISVLLRLAYLTSHLVLRRFCCKW